MSRRFTFRSLSTYIGAPILSALFLAGSAVAQAAVLYRVIPLPVIPSHISNAGTVAGKTPENNAATWDRQHGLQILPVPGEPSSSEARASNRAGDVAGFANGDSSTAFSYKNHKMVLLPGKNSRALAVNDSGSIAGEAEVDGKPPLAALLWKGGRVNKLGVGTARGINNRGQVIADLYDQAGHYQAFLWENARLQTLSSSGGYSSALALNDAGHVLVQEIGRGMFLWRGRESPVRIEIPDNQPADGKALNNAEEVVGAFGPYFDAYHAFVWSEKRGFRDLNRLIPPNSGWTLQVATGINDQGEIVGFGEHNGEDAAGFLLVPEENPPKR